jgi:RecJ-like exonuclease
MNVDEAMVTCPECDGTGEVHSHNPKCWGCSGRGKVTADRAKKLETDNDRLRKIGNYPSDGAWTALAEQVIKERDAARIEVERLCIELAEVKAELKKLEDWADKIENSFM